MKPRSIVGRDRKLLYDIKSENIRIFFGIVCRATESMKNSLEVFFAKAYHKTLIDGDGLFLEANLIAMLTH